MNWIHHLRIGIAPGAILALLAPLSATAHEPPFTAEFDRDRCTFTTVGSHPYFPLWPGLVLHLEGEDLDDEMELIEVEAFNSVLADTEMVDGVRTRVYEEREFEDGELVEVSRNFFAVCRETGDVWYFGEDVDDYEDGEIVGHGGAWRSGIAGAQAGIIMPGTPLLGARYLNELAPGVAMDQGEVITLDAELEVPAGEFDSVLYVVETSPLDPGITSEKWYARGIGYIKDDVLELVDVTAPPCQPDATTHCLNNGRFEVTAEWHDFTGGQGDAQAILASGDSGEFWFFAPDNTELLVKVLDACDFPGGANYWVFAAGLTNVEVSLSVTDTATDEARFYTNPSGASFQPILDTTAFSTCP